MWNNKTIKSCLMIYLIAVMIIINLIGKNKIIWMAALNWIQRNKVIPTIFYTSNSRDITMTKALKKGRKKIFLT